MLGIVYPIGIKKIMNKNERNEHSQAKYNVQGMRSIRQTGHSNQTAVMLQMINISYLNSFFLPMRLICKRIRCVHAESH